MSKWSEKFPTPKAKKSIWWFYGWAYGRMEICDTDGIEPELTLVECIKNKKCYTYISDGQFLYKSEAIGVFKKFEGIETPPVDDLREIADLLKG